jgi:hypothetical protein
MLFYGRQNRIFHRFILLVLLDTEDKPGCQPLSRVI